jgi:hypothetical protein
MAALVNWIPLLLRRRKRDQRLAEAASWPVITARLLKSIVVEIDPLAPPGTSFQTSQVESAFYFTLENHRAGSYFGGHLRSTAVSDSEGHRLLRTLPEDTPVQVRYNPQNPDQTCVFARDNQGALPITIWDN